MDIRKYFGGFAHKDSGNNKRKENRNTKNEETGRKAKESSESPLPKKRRRLVVLSDSESDEENPIPTQSKQNKTLPAEKKKAKASPENHVATASQNTKKPLLSLKRLQSGSRKSPSKSPLKLQPVTSASHYFGAAPIIRSKRKIFANDDNNDFKKKLSVKDESPDITEVEDETESKKSSQDTNDDTWPEINEASSDGADVKVILHLCDKKSDTVFKEVKRSPNRVTKPSQTKAVTSKDDEPEKAPKNETKSPSPMKTSLENSRASSTSPEDVRKNSSVNYKKYLERAGPQALGSKTIPEGKEGCFEGLAFVLSGVLESMEREEAAELIKKYNGRVTGNVSKKTNYLVAGREVGPSKLDKANKLGVKIINEDELLELITTMSSAVKSPSQKTCPRKEESTSSKRSPASKPAKQTVSPDTKTELPMKKPKTPLKVEPVIKKQTIETVPEKPVMKPDTRKTKTIRYENDDDDRDVQELLWVDKYKPSSCKQIIGQQGDRSNMNKLMAWLRNWHKNNNGEKKKRPPPGRMWGGNDDGSAFKAALLSGPPGVGKTTTATLVCKALGFSFVELNASDTRSKRNLQEEVKELLSNRSLSVLSTGSTSTSKHCLLMDEVDGMSGNQDRGGMQELIQLIKNSKIPIICMCNDRNHQKIRSLSNYCFDLRFSRPRAEQIKAAMMSMCFKENLKITPQAMQEVIVGANHDVRQIIHHLSVWSVNEKNLSTDKAHHEAQKAKKDEKLNPFDTLRKVFSATDHKTMSIHDKTELFFFDYSLIPLFVEENYVNMNPISAQNNLKKTLKLVSETADSICEGDLIEKIIRRDGNWDLLPVQALYSSVIPGEFMKCNVPHQIAFPSWLGKYSRRNKLSRFTHELSSHMRLKLQANPSELNMDYLPLLRDAITKPLLRDEMNGVHSAVAVLHAYDLLRDDMDSIMELTTWPGKKDPFSGVNSKVKAAFTRTYNSSGHLIPYAVAGGTARKRATAASVDAEDMEGGELEGDGYVSEEEDDNIESDVMIKVKKTTNSKKQQKAETAAASSQGKGKGRGKKGKS